MSHCFTVTLPSGHLDLERCLMSGQVFRVGREDGRWRVSDGAHTYWIREPDGTRIRPRADALAYLAEDRPRYGEATETFAVESNATEADFRRFFRLDWDAAEVEREILARGPELEPYLGAIAGLRLLRPASAVESFYSFLCTANNNIRRIIPMVGTLATYGEGDFPGSETIARIPEGVLRAKGFGYRAATIPSVAREVLDRGGDSWIWSLRDVPYEEAHEALIGLKYVGRKLADCICLFGLGHPGVVPIDTHLWQALTREYFPGWRGTPLTDAKYREARAFVRGRFGELTGWAHQCLFYDNVLNWRSRRGE